MRARLRSTYTQLHGAAWQTPIRAVPCLTPFVLIGFGIGLAFAAISVAAMTDITEGEAGLASGLLTTRHELGAAIGAALVSTIAFVSGDFVTGYGHGALAAAGFAGLIALVASAAIPSTRPPNRPQLAAH